MRIIFHWQVARTPGIPLYNYLLDQHVNLECYIWKAWTDPLAMRSSDLQAGSIRPVVVQVGVQEADRESPANVLCREVSCVESDSLFDGRFPTLWDTACHDAVELCRAVRSSGSSGLTLEELAFGNRLGVGIQGRSCQVGVVASREIHNLVNRDFGFATLRPCGAHRHHWLRWYQLLSLLSSEKAQSGGDYSSIKWEPPAPEINFHPSTKIHRIRNRGNANVAEVTGHITVGDIHAAAKSSRKVCEVAAYPTRSRKASSAVRVALAF